MDEFPALYSQEFIDYLVELNTVTRKYYRDRASFLAAEIHCDTETWLTLELALVKSFDTMVVVLEKGEQYSGEG
jgi:hypothetical protein